MMKSFFKKLAFVMALAMVVSMAAPAATTASAASSLRIAYQNGSYGLSEVNIAEVGGQEDLKFLGAPSNWKELGAKWTSNNEAVATVDKAGVVTAVSAGTAEIAVQIGSEVAVVKVNCVNTETYTATIGVAAERSITEKTIEEGDTFDFAFYGIKDFDPQRYFCTWASDDTTVATVDQKGLVTAVKPGTAKITLIVFNKVTGKVHNVTPCVVTVPNGEPTTAPVNITVSAKQTTENDMTLTFTGVDVTTLKKEDIEVYEYYVNEAGETQEYVWQFYEINEYTIDKENGTIDIVGYTSEEFQDGCEYVVRYVEVVNEGTAEEESKVIAETTFTASVGEVVAVNAWYASYYNNNYGWQFYNHAYTNAGSGEEIETKVFYSLIDANGIDVTGHYSTLLGGEDLVTLELVNEDLDFCMTWDESTNEIIFFEIPENPLIRFNVIYDDFETGKTVSTVLPMIVEEAPAYTITSIDDWVITLNANADGTYSYPQDWTDYKKKDIALYDDYDQSTGEELLNHELVIWFTDNYGNKYVTNDKFVSWPYFSLSTSEKFGGEGFELHYESRNPQVLVVGDDYIGGDVNSAVLTTKKTGTASVNVTLYNTYEEILVSRLGSVSITVKPERYIKTVSADSITLTTDSKPDGAIASYVSNDLTDGDTYDTRFTSNNIYFTVVDQYGDAWGLYNKTLYNNLECVAESTNTGVSSRTDSDWTLNTSSMKYSANFDGVTLYYEAGTKVSSVSYKLTVTDLLHEEEKSTTFRVSLKYPSEDDTTNTILCKSKLQLSAGNGTYINTKNFTTTIKVEEMSNNGYAVNYADGITLITNKTEYNNLFTNKTASASEGALYLVVLNPKNEIVSTPTGNAIGINTLESGLYNFVFADDHNGTQCTEFALAGNYTVKLIEVTGTTSNDKVKTFTTTSTKFTLKDDRIDINLKNQAEIYVGYDTWYIDEGYGLNGIARYAFEYDDNFWQWSNGVVDTTAAGVRFKVNSRASQIVINDVFFKVMIDKNKDGNRYNDTAWYYVEVPVDKTITLENVSIVSSDSSIKNGYDPDGNKMQ